MYISILYGRMCRSYLAGECFLLPLVTLRVILLLSSHTQPPFTMVQVHSSPPYNHSTLRTFVFKMVNTAGSELGLLLFRRLAIIRLTVFEWTLRIYFTGSVLLKLALRQGRQCVFYFGLEKNLRIAEKRPFLITGAVFISFLFPTI